MLGVVHNLLRSGGLRWHGIQIKFHKDSFGHTGNVKNIITMSEVVVLILLMGTNS